MWHMSQYGDIYSDSDSDSVSFAEIAGGPQLIFSICECICDPTLPPCQHVLSH